VNESTRKIYLVKGFFNFVANKHTPCDINPHDSYKLLDTALIQNCPWNPKNTKK